MGLVAAKCTQCGANIKVDATRDAGICPHCGTPFVTEKAINYYNTTNLTTNNYNSVTNINGGEVHIHESDENADRMFRNISGLIKEGVLPEDTGYGDCDTLYNLIEKFEKKYPLDYRRYEATAMCMLEKINRNDYNLASSFPDLAKLKAVNPEVGEKYYKEILEKVNGRLYESSGIPFTGDMLDLKILIGDLKKQQDDWFGRWDKYKIERDKYEKESKLYEAEEERVKAYGGIVFMDKPFAPWMPEAFSTLFKEKFEQGAKIIQNPRHGRDGDYLIYLLCALKVHSPEAVYTRESYYVAFADALDNSLTAEEKLRIKDMEAKEKEAFFEKNKKDYEWLWQGYVEYLSKGEVKKAYGLLLYHPELPRGKFILDVNFKKGLFGVKYKQNIADRDVEALTLASLEEGYKDKNKK